MVTVNWTAIVLLVMGLFALAGFFKGWWREAIVTIFLAILVVFLQLPGVAQFFIDSINAVMAFIWGILPESVVAFLETTFGLGTAGRPPTIDASSPQTWIIMLIIFIGLAVLVGRLGLAGSARNASSYRGYVVTLGGRLFGALLGAVNAWHKGGAGRCAQCIDVEIGKPDALAVQFVQVGCDDVRVAVDMDVSISLVVGHDQYHIRLCL